MARGVRLNRTIPAYLPKNLNLTELLENHPPTFKYHIDNFRYIISLITEIPGNNKDLLDKYDYVPINTQMLQSKVREYKNCIDYLLVNGVLETDNHYTPGDKARGYRFTAPYSVEVKIEAITKRSLIKHATKQSSYVGEMENKYKYLRKWFDDDLQIDYDGALAYLTEQLKQNMANGVKNALLKFNASFMCLHRLNSKNFYFKVDTTVGRLHTNLTAIKSELRNFITYKGQKMVSVDIVNSQPLLSCGLLKADTYQQSQIGVKINKESNFINKSIKKYIKSTQTISNILSFIMLVKSDNNQAIIGFEQYIKYSSNGQIYEFISAEIERTMGKKIADRKALKAIVFTVLFTDNRYFGQPDAEPKRLFKSLFPSVYNVFSLIKTSDSAILPKLLQAIEAKLILDIIAKRLSKELPDVVILTIHDSITCPVGHEDTVAKIMEEEITKAIGITPTLKYDFWTPDTLAIKPDIAA